MRARSRVQAEPIIRGPQRDVVKNEAESLLEAISQKALNTKIGRRFLCSDLFSLTIYKCTSNILWQRGPRRWSGQ